MAGKRFLLAIALLLLTSSHLLAQPSIVNVQLKPGNPRTIEVTPNASVVCRNTPGCPTELNFRWVGPAGADESETISVKYLEGLYWEADKPAAIPATACFTFPGNQNPFELQHGAANGRNLVFKQADPACKDKVAFFFEISCQNEALDNCGGVVTLDPGTMIDNGG